MMWKWRIVMMVVVEMGREAREARWAKLWDMLKLEKEDGGALGKVHLVLTVRRTMRLIKKREQATRVCHILNPFPRPLAHSFFLNRPRHKIRLKKEMGERRFVALRSMRKRLWELLEVERRRLSRSGTLDRC